eukprot:s20_g9.t1
MPRAACLNEGFDLLPLATSTQLWHAVQVLSLHGTACTSQDFPSEPLWKDLGPLCMDPRSKSRNQSAGVSEVQEERPKLSTRSPHLRGFEINSTR